MVFVSICLWSCEGVLKKEGKRKRQRERKRIEEGWRRDGEDDDGREGRDNCPLQDVCVVKKREERREGRRAKNFKTKNKKQNESIALFLDIFQRFCVFFVLTATNSEISDNLFSS